MPLNIPIGDDFLITSDPMNVIVNRKHIVDPTKGPKWQAGDSTELREVWRASKWFTTIEQALGYIVEQSARESEAESVAALRKEMAALKRQISEVMA